MNKEQSDKHIPSYIKLYNKMREDIVTGIYAYGSRLPSKRTLADTSGLSTVTVEHAYALLCDEGYIASKERSGYFVIFNTDNGFATSELDEDHVNSITVTEGSEGFPQFPFSVLSRTMRKVLSEYSETVLNRSPNKGCVELREAIKNYLAKNRGIHATTEQIIIGSGAEYLYGLIIEVIGRDRRYGIEAPSYQKIEQVYKAAEVVYEMLPLSNDGISARTLNESNADVLHISPYRSFPSGVTASASKRHEYIRFANSRNGYIIEDDFESEFSVLRKTEETLFSLSDCENVIYINSFSKTVSPSFRTAYMILPKHLVERFDKKVGFYSCTVPTYMQLVLAKLIENGDFARHINRVRRQEREKLQ